MARGAATALFVAVLLLVLVRRMREAEEGEREREREIFESGGRNPTGSRRPDLSGHPLSRLSPYNINEKASQDSLCRRGKLRPLGPFCIIILLIGGGILILLYVHQQ